jgi:hypothetical protein
MRYGKYIALTLLAILVLPLATGIAINAQGNGIFYVDVNGVSCGAATCEASPGDAITVYGVSYQGTLPLVINITDPETSELVYQLNVYPRSDGTFSATFILPKIPHKPAPWYYVITVATIAGDELTYEPTGEIYHLLNVIPKIKVSPSSLTNFDNIKVEGFGFSAAASVKIQIHHTSDPSSAVLWSVNTTTDDTGSFTYETTYTNGLFDVVSLTKGNHLLSVLDPDITVNATALLLIKPDLRIAYYWWWWWWAQSVDLYTSITFPFYSVTDVTDPYLELVFAGLDPMTNYTVTLINRNYTKIVLTVGSFGMAGAYVGNFYSDTEAIFESDSYGTLWLWWYPPGNGFDMYSIPGGTYDVKIEEFNDTWSETFTGRITYNSLIEVYPSTATVGQELAVTGYSFIPGVDGDTFPITIYFDRDPVKTIYFDTSLALPAGNMSGTFNTSFRVAWETASGGHEVRAVETVQNIQLEAMYNVIIGSAYEVVVPNPVEPGTKQVRVPPPEEAKFKEDDKSVYVDGVYEFCSGCDATGTCTCGGTVVGQEECIYSSVIQVVVYGLSPGETVTIFLDRYYTYADTLRDLAVSYDWYFSSAGLVDNSRMVLKTFVANNTIETITLPVIPLPKGTYNISVKTDAQGDIPPVSDTAKQFEVVDTLFITPTVIIGPTTIEIWGTGFPAAEPIEFVAPIINGTDGIAGVNSHMQTLTTWTVDNNGTLTAQAFGGLTVKPAIYFPILEPGVYELRLVYRLLGTGEFDSTAPSYIYVVNNIPVMATTTDISNLETALTTQLTNLETTLTTKLDDIASQIVDELVPTITAIDTKLDSYYSDVSDQLGGISSSIDDVGSRLDEVDARLDAVGTQIIDLMSGVEDIKSLLNTEVLYYLALINNSIGGITVDFTPVMNELSSLSAKIDGLETSLGGQLATLGADVGAVKALLTAFNDTAVTLLADIDYGVYNELPNVVSSSTSEVTGAVSSAKSDILSAVSEAKSEASAAKSAVTDLQTVLGSKVDSVTTILYVTTVLALLAFIAAVLAFVTARKATLK